jgi:hypothetical protein
MAFEHPGLLDMAHPCTDLSKVEDSDEYGERL